jgi:uncharacterized integral membrane protein
MTLETNTHLKQYRYIYLLSAIGLTPGGISTVHIYTQTIHRTTQLIWEELQVSFHLVQDHGTAKLSIKMKCAL